jgi:hypothetical protein
VPHEQGCELQQPTRDDFMLKARNTAGISMGSGQEPVVGSTWLVVAQEAKRRRLPCHRQRKDPPMHQVGRLSGANVASQATVGALALSLTYG